jgi:integrase
MKEKQRYWLLKRRSSYYIWDTITGKRTSLQTNDKATANGLVQAKNDALKPHAYNLALAKVHLAAADPLLSQRNWDMVMKEFVGRSGRNSTKLRREREFLQPRYGQFREKVITETTADELLAVIKAGGVYGNSMMRCLHNLAVGLGWLPWPIIPPKLWPQTTEKKKRGITEEEFRAIITNEQKPERRAYYELLWEIGASQTDAAELTADNIDWEKRILFYRRNKTGELACISIGNRLEQLLKRLPNRGPLFPTLVQSNNRWRAAEFRRRCRLLGIEGVSLHSFRYGWAFRAKALGYPERFAMQHLGHNSPAVHEAYANGGAVVCPSLEEFEKKIVKVEFELQKGSAKNRRSNPQASAGF